MRGWFVTGVGTGVGKTFVARGVARALTRRGERVAAVKPLETGVGAGGALDAIALERACGGRGLASAAGFYRAELPASPYAAELEGGPRVPPVDVLAAAVRACTAGADTLIVEGAGGVLVPLTKDVTTADLMVTLGLPVLVVARDALGVLSLVSTALESLSARHIAVAAVVLTMPSDDASVRTNGRIVAERARVVHFALCADDDERLADAADASGLLD